MANIIRMAEEHRECVLDMMRVFYTSPAVFTDGSEEIYKNDVEHCISDDPFVEGYVFEEDGSIVGYAMLAKSFSTEFGRRCIWIEDLYLLPQCRGKGIGSEFFRFVEEKYPDAILRLEVEEENASAVHTYKKNGFDVLPYMEMKKIL